MNGVADAAAQRCKDHAAACAAACAASGLCAPSLASARALLTAGAADVAAAHALPLDDAWHAALHLRLEYLYSTSLPQMCVRLLVSLPHMDGVSGLRVALHTLEALEGTAVCAGSAFKRNPPFRYSAAHLARGLALALPTAAGALWAWLRSGTAQPVDAAAPRTSAGLFAYYSAASPAPARFRCYAPKGDGKAAYKAMLAAAQQWHDATGRHAGFFNLINQPPHVLPSIVPRAVDMNSMERRYAGVLLPPAPPPMGAAWLIANHVHIPGALQHATSRMRQARRIDANPHALSMPPPALFVNNYGRHDHTFKAAATAFLWDWAGMAAPIAGFGCVAVNGTFMAWVRGTPADMAGCKAVFAAALGDAVSEHDQIAWPAKHGTPPAGAAEAAGSKHD